MLEFRIDDQQGCRVALRTGSPIHAAPPSPMKGVKNGHTQMLFEVLNLDTRRTK